MEKSLHGVSTIAAEAFEINFHRRQEVILYLVYLQSLS